MAWVSCFPVTDGTTTVGMFGPPLTTSFTAEFFGDRCARLGICRQDVALGGVAGPDGAASHGEVVVVQRLRCLAGRETDDVGHGHVVAEDPEGAQEEEGDHGQGHQQQRPAR